MSENIFDAFKQKILSKKFSEGTISEIEDGIEIKTPYAVIWE